LFPEGVFTALRLPSEHHFMKIPRKVLDFFDIISKKYHFNIFLKKQQLLSCSQATPVFMVLQHNIFYLM